MTKIYMVRHGQSLSNVAETFTGTIESPLSELGCHQAELCAEYLKDKNPDRIFASNISRAYNTGLALGKILGKPVEKKADFREINGAMWEGLRFFEIESRFPDNYNVWKNSMDDAVCNGGESVAALQRRVVGALLSVSKEFAGQCVAVFTHATPIRTAAAYALGQSIQETPWPANSSVSEFECDGEKLILKSYGYNDFLGNCVTVLPKNV